MQKTDLIGFNKLTTHATNGYFDFTVPADGTIEKVGIYFAPGQTFDLHVNVVILQRGSKIPDPVIQYADGTDNFMSGDGIMIERAVTRPLDAGDVIRVIYDNIDPVNDMNLAVDVTVDYYGGKQRVV